MPNPAQQRFVDWDKINAALKVKLAIDEQNQMNEVQAMQWQGQQDYQTLTDSGVDPAEALRRAAPKLFFNDPVGLTRAVGAIKARQARPTPESVQPAMRTLEDGTKVFWSGASWQRVPTRAEQGDPTEFVNVSSKDATGRMVTKKVPAAEERKKEISDATTAYNAAKSATGWFGMSKPDTAGMNSASNTLVNLGAPVPGQPIAPPALQPPATPAAPTAPIPSSTTAPFPANQPPQPNSKHIKYLMDNPGSAAQFNFKFGPGAAEELLKRRLSPGTIMGGSGIRG